MTRVFVCFGLLMLALGSAPLSAVERSRDGFGDVLLFPYFSVGGSVDTMLSVGARDVVPGPAASGAVALRVVLRFASPAPGVDIDPLFFHVYLGASDSWTMVLAREQGQLSVLSADQSCVQAGRPGALLGGLPVRLQETVLPQFDIDRAEGWIEVYELGGIAHGDVGTAARTRSCETLWQLLDTQDPESWLTAPADRLRGVVHLVDAAGGTGYSFAPVALARFRDAPVFTTVDLPYPGLADASPAQARLTFSDGVQRTSSFAAAPVQAVSAVLMDIQWDMDFTAESVIAAETDLVLTLPTRPYRDDDGALLAPFRLRSELVRDIPTQARVFDREGRIQDPAASPKCTPPPQIQPGPRLDGDLNVIAFGSDGLLESIRARPLLWYDPGFCNMGPGVPVHERIQAGRFSLRFPADELVSDEGHVFFGIPAIPLALSRAVNGDLGGVRANYGLTQPVARAALQETP
ncbi:MAG TPA: hypothetical protein PKZ76_00770 [Xanthomonadaceae bacterium]|nr:hypothetical protein [Xanthomonadaceae bacterium]